MIKVGLIGYGKWGKILHKNIMSICNVKFICRSTDDYKSKLKDVDWVIVATPNDTHYNIVSECIRSGKMYFVKNL